MVPVPSMRESLAMCFCLLILINPSDGSAKTEIARKEQNVMPTMSNTIFVRFHVYGIYTGVSIKFVPNIFGSG